jgi:hypothetical protein
VVIRKSGTEPLIRVMAEGEDEGWSRRWLTTLRSGGGSLMLEKRPDCERCGANLPPDREAPSSARSSAPFAPNAPTVEERCPQLRRRPARRPMRTGAALKRSPASTERRFRR